MTVVEVALATRLVLRGDIEQTVHLDVVSDTLVIDTGDLETVLGGTGGEELLSTAVDDLSLVIDEPAAHLHVQLLLDVLLLVLLLVLVDELRHFYHVVDQTVAHGPQTTPLLLLVH